MLQKNKNYKSNTKGTSLHPLATNHKNAMSSPV